MLGNCVTSNPRGPLRRFDILLNMFFFPGGLTRHYRLGGATLQDVAYLPIRGFLLPAYYDIRVKPKWPSLRFLIILQPLNIIIAVVHLVQ